MLFVNFKTYEEATGSKAVELAKICEKMANQTGKKIILVVQAADIYRVSQAVKLDVFSQHADEADYGSNTGHIIIDALKQAGASGTILNHSENRILMAKIKAVVGKCKKKKFKVLVCAQNAEEVGEIAELNPDYVAYEPPELIGGDISVSTAKPEVIEESLKAAGKVPLIVGAGIKRMEDVRKSIEIGAKGVLVASGIVKAKDPEKALRDLAAGL